VSKVPLRKALYALAVAAANHGYDVGSKKRSVNPLTLSRFVEEAFTKIAKPKPPKQKMVQFVGASGRARKSGRGQITNPAILKQLEDVYE
jgi:hypothetical protein